MCKVLSFVSNPRIFITTRIHGVFEADNYDNDLVIGIGYKAIIFIEERDPNDATEFDDNEFVSAIFKLNMIMMKKRRRMKVKEVSKRAHWDSRSNTPLGQFLNGVNTFKAWIKTEINLLGRNLRLGLAFLNVG